MYFIDLLSNNNPDPETYAGSSVPTGRASHARQVKMMAQTKLDTPLLQVGGWVRG